MKVFKNIFRMIYFAMFLFIELSLNFLVVTEFVSFFPFFLLLFIFSTNRFSNENIFPIIGCGLIYDIFLSEGYLGLYSILFLTVAIISNFSYERFFSYNYGIYFSFSITFMIYNSTKIVDLISFLALFVSLVINFLIYTLIKKFMVLNV